MPKVLRHNEKRHAAHDGLRRPSVSQYMETCRRIDFGTLADLSHYSRLLRLLPPGAVRSRQHDLRSTAASRNPLEECGPFLGQLDRNSLHLPATTLVAKIMQVTFLDLLAILLPHNVRLEVAN